MENLDNFKLDNFKKIIDEIKQETILENKFTEKDFIKEKNKLEESITNTKNKNINSITKIKKDDIFKQIESNNKKKESFLYKIKTVFSLNK